MAEANVARLQPAKCPALTHRHATALHAAAAAPPALEVRSVLSRNHSGSFRSTLPVRLPHAATFDYFSGFQGSDFRFRF
jgi:hypothetical protein